MPEPHPTWEYLTVPAVPAPDLAALGEDGWELVGVGGPPEAQTLFFKRPARSFRERVTLDQKRRYYALWDRAGADGPGPGRGGQSA